MCVRELVLPGDAHLTQLEWCGRNLCVAHRAEYVLISSRSGTHPPTSSHALTYPPISSHLLTHPSSFGAHLVAPRRACTVHAPRTPAPRAPCTRATPPAWHGTGAVRELFAFAPEYGSPLLARLPHGELLVVQPPPRAGERQLGVFVDSRGRVTRRSAVHWRAPPLACGFHEQQLVTLLPRSIEAHRTT